MYSIFIFIFPFCNFIPSGKDKDQKYIRKNRSMNKEKEEDKYKEEKKGGQGKEIEKWKKTTRR
jgi:hypothetical protein